MTEFDGLKVAHLPQASFWSPYTGVYGIGMRTVCRPVNQASKSRIFTAVFCTDVTVYEF
jgi:hypothetical protein